MLLLFFSRSAFALGPHFELEVKSDKTTVVKGDQSACVAMRSGEKKGLKAQHCRELIAMAKKIPASHPGTTFSPHAPTYRVRFMEGPARWVKSVDAVPVEGCDVNDQCTAAPADPLRELAKAVLESAASF